MASGSSDYVEEFTCVDIWISLSVTGEEFLDDEPTPCATHCKAFLGRFRQLHFRTSRYFKSSTIMAAHFCLSFPLEMLQPPLICNGFIV
jgi:hypothetical protein